VTAKDRAHAAVDACENEYRDWLGAMIHAIAAAIEAAVAEEREACAEAAEVMAHPPDAWGRTSCDHPVCAAERLAAMRIRARRGP
jgi:hypothetical protein